MKNLTVNSSPHLRSPDTTTKIMTYVLIALAPSFAASICFFGTRSAVVTIVAMLSCVLFEYLFCVFTKKENTITDLSAVVTGTLLAFNLPVTIPLYMIVIGSFVSIVVVKMLFGGLGANFANPAIVGRIVLALSFTQAMSSFIHVEIGSWIYGDAVTSATPLADPSAAPPLWDLFIGNHGGTLGETSALAILIGGIFLVITKIIKPAIPAFFIGTVFLLKFTLTGGDFTASLAYILMGGLFLGAFFMATDYVTSPKTTSGKIIFAVGCGIITVVIREFASLPEGVSYSILLMNLLVPYIERLTAPKPFGLEKKTDDKRSKL